MGNIHKNDKSYIPTGLSTFLKSLCQDKNGWISDYSEETGPVKNGRGMAEVKSPKNGGPKGQRPLRSKSKANKLRIS
jgi:hypothetical protein